MSVQKLTNTSAHYEHFSKYKFLDSQLLSGQGSIGYLHGWLVSRHGKEMTYWQGGNSTPYRCACGLTRSWADPRCGCNCDINDYVWREYRKLLTNMVELRSSDLIETWWYRGSWRQWTRQPHPWKAEVLLHKLRVLQVIHVRQVQMKDRVHQTKESNIL